MALHRMSGTTAIAGDRGNALAAVYIAVGDANTRATAVADLDTTPGRFPPAIGSMYVTTAGKVYVKVSQSTPPAATDWQRVTTTAAD